MSIKKDEWLTFEDTNKGLEVLKEKPLDYYSDVFSPWQTKQKLKIWREVEWNVWWWQFKLWSFTISATGNITITWVWFKPKLIQFSYSATTWKWEWEMTSTEMRAYDPKTLGTLTINCIYIRDSASNVIARATYVSMDNDWFTINCSFTSASLVVYYTAFG